MTHESNPLLIHVGYHKTGTTWLQHALFKTEFGYHPLMDHKEVFETIVRPHGLLFDPDLAQHLIAARTGQFTDGEVNVISSELLCGNPLIGGRESDGLAERLKAIAPEARILITIREQMRMLASVYMQYISRGGSLDPHTFFLDQPDLGYTTFAPEHFEYHRLIQKYQTLFGLSRVCVLTQEQLSGDIDGYLADLAKFAGNEFYATATPPSKSRIGVSFPESFVGPFRAVNFLRRGPTGPDSLLGALGLGRRLYHGVGRVSRSRLMAGLAKSHKPVSQFVAERFKDRFVESNRELRMLVPEQAKWLEGYQ